MRDKHAGFTIRFYPAGEECTAPARPVHGDIDSNNPSARPNKPTNTNTSASASGIASAHALTLALATATATATAIATTTSENAAGVLLVAVGVSWRAMLSHPRIVGAAQTVLGRHGAQGHSCGACNT